MKNKSTQNTLIMMALLSTLIAVGFHTYLTLHFYALKYGAVGTASVCNINAVLNCDAVTASKYSSFLGIPVALWGLFTNLILAYFFAIVRFNLVQDREKTSRYALLISGFVVLASVVMGAISTRLGNICLFCVGAYFLSLISFAGAYLGASKVSLSQVAQDIKDIFTTEKWVAGFLITIPALTFMANIMYLETQGLSKIAKMAEEAVAYWSVAPTQKFDLTKGLSIQKGSEPPVMTIVEFADFRCPHCKFAAPTLHAFVNNHPDVRLIFKPFPLDSTCNEGLKSGDGISCGLAAAVICSEKIAKKGWVAHDYFFEKQEEILQARNLEDNIKALSQAASINNEELLACTKESGTQEAIRLMAKEGLDAKIQGTPSVFVNEKLLNGGQMIPVLEAAYQKLK